MKISPNHFAGHHYLTHAHENAGRIDTALEHGAAYAKLAPQVPHARHMHGHDLRRLGRVEQAIVEFEAADALHRAYVTQEKLPAEYDWHFHHNLDLLASSHQYAGRMTRAETLLKGSFDLPSNLVVQVYNKREWPAFLRGRGRLEAALAAAQVLGRHPHPVIQAAGHIEAGYALLAMGRWADAAAESNAALTTLKTAPPGAGLAGPAFQGLQGELALRTADRAKGRQVLEDLARKVRALPGADGWIQALFILEASARTARQVGDWELAGALARVMLEHDPAYAGTHYALGLVADHDGDAPAARAAFALAQKYWSKADQDLPELADIRRRLK
jgi:tetratricopeptide (TPR) repeat protein